VASAVHRDVERTVEGAAAMRPTGERASAGKEGDRDRVEDDAGGDFEASVVAGCVATSALRNEHRAPNSSGVAGGTTWAARGADAAGGEVAVEQGSLIYEKDGLCMLQLENNTLEPE
jgi:hypothetical protein